MKTFLLFFQSYEYYMKPHQILFLNIIKKYYQMGYVTHTPKDIMKRMERTIHPSTDTYKMIISSIQYPLQNGKFVILLDKGSEKDIKTYVRTLQISRTMSKHIHEFNKSIRKAMDAPQGTTHVDINSYKFPKFQVTKIRPNAMKKKPKLTKSIST